MTIKAVQIAGKWLELPKRVQQGWFPGHMMSASREMERRLKHVDVVVELRDARVALSSAVPYVELLAQRRHRVILLNKEELADPHTMPEMVRHIRLSTATLPFKQLHVMPFSASALRSNTARTLRPFLETLARVASPAALPFSSSSAPSPAPCAPLESATSYRPLLSSASLSSSSPSSVISSIRASPTDLNISDPSGLFLQHCFDFDFDIYRFLYVCFLGHK